MFARYTIPAVNLAVASEYPSHGGSTIVNRRETIKESIQEFHETVIRIGHK